MTNDKLKEMVEAENEELARVAERKARDIIREIGRLTSLIEDSKSRIVALRSDLRALQVNQIDPVNILGA